MAKKIWITWENQRRNRSLSEALGAKLYVFEGGRKAKIVRYVFCIVATLNVIRREKPEILFVQNPSLVLATLAVLLSKITNILVVVDAHNGGLKPLDGVNRALNVWADLIVKFSPITIVTNHVLEKSVAVKTQNTLAVLADPIPVIRAPVWEKKLVGAINVLFVCTWAYDEPFKEVLKAACMLEETTHIYITGDFIKHFGSSPDQLPANVTLTGFITDSDFECLLGSTDIIMDLTDREGCLVCGAYEALALNKPLILSNTEASKTYFTDALHTNNDAAAIAKTINHAKLNLTALGNKSLAMKDRLDQKWEQQRSDLERKINHCKKKHVD